MTAEPITTTEVPTSPADWRVDGLDRLEILDPTRKTLGILGIVTLGELAERIDSGDTMELKRSTLSNLRAALDAVRFAEGAEPSHQPGEGTENRIVEQLVTAGAEALNAAGINAVAEPSANGTHKATQEPTAEQPKRSQREDDSDDAASLKALRAQEELVQRIEGEMADLKEEYAAKKGEGKAAVVKLRRMVRESKEPNLFTKPKKPKVKPSNDAPDVIFTVTPDADDTWRAVPLASLSLPAGIVAKLAAVGIGTVGELADYQEPDKNTGWTKQLTDIAGIGKGAAEKIGAATEQFWSERKKAGAL